MGIYWRLYRDNGHEYADYIGILLHYSLLTTSKKGLQELGFSGL